MEGSVRLRRAQAPERALDLAGSVRSSLRDARRTHAKAFFRLLRKSKGIAAVATMALSSVIASPAAQASVQAGPYMVVAPTPQQAQFTTYLYGLKNPRADIYRFEFISNSGKGRVTLRKTYAFAAQQWDKPAPGTFWPNAWQYQGGTGDSVGYIPGINMTRPSQTDKVVVRVSGADNVTLTGYIHWALSTKYPTVWFSNPTPKPGQTFTVYERMLKTNYNLELIIESQVKVYAGVKPGFLAAKVKFGAGELGYLGTIYPPNYRLGELKKENLKYTYYNWLIIK